MSRFEPQLLFLAGVFVVAAVLLYTTPFVAAEEPDAVKPPETVGTEVMNLKHRLVRLTDEIHKLSRSLTEDEDELQNLEQRERELLADLARRRDGIAHLLLALQRFARLPNLAIAVLPQSPGDTVRSLLLLRSGLANLRSETARLESQISDLDRLKTGIARKRANRDDRLARLKSERRTVSIITREKQNILNRQGIQQGHPEQKPDDVGMLAHPTPLTEISKNQAAAGVSAPASTADPTVADDIPAPGRLVVRFGQLLQDDSRSRGITIQTRPNEQVVAPIQGRVVFADIFGDYGNLVIVRSRDGQHALVSGMARIDAVPGEEVLAGEPIGVMDAKTVVPPRLYFELRKNGRPINPLSTRATSTNKGRKK